MTDPGFSQVEVVVRWGGVTGAAFPLIDGANI